jgi:hypothetical protein
MRRLSSPNVANAETAWQNNRRTFLKDTISVIADRLLDEGVGFIKDENHRVGRLNDDRLRIALYDVLDDRGEGWKDYLSLGQEAYNQFNVGLAVFRSKIEKSRFRIEEVVSPTTGVHGWKITRL